LERKFRAVQFSNPARPDAVCGEVATRSQIRDAIDAIDPTCRWCLESFDDLQLLPPAR
jgi:hypothetical protein